MDLKAQHNSYWLNHSKEDGGDGVMGIIHADWAFLYSLPGRERAGKQAFVGHLLPCRSPITVMLLTLWVGTIIHITQMTWREDQWFILKNQLSKKQVIKSTFFANRCLIQHQGQGTPICVTLLWAHYLWQHNHVDKVGKTKGTQFILLPSQALWDPTSPPLQYSGFILQLALWAASTYKKKSCFGT